MNVTAKLSENAVNLRSCGANLNKSLGEIVGYKGDPSYEVQALNRDAEPRRLWHWKILDPYCGAWIDIGWQGGGARGDDLISLVEHLGQCARPIAVEFLAGLVARIERSAA